jgi:hypothetical protein
MRVETIEAFVLVPCHAHFAAAFGKPESQYARQGLKDWGWIAQG